MNVVNEHPKGKGSLMIKSIVLILSIALSSNIYALNLHSRYALIYNETTDQIIYEKNSSSSVPIASITKLMTAIITLESNQDLSKTITITKDDIDTLKHTRSRIPIGTRLTKDKALLLMLMSSENRAASALLRNYPGGRQAALKAIQAKITELGLTSTKIVDANGLNPKNVSSSIDLAKIVKYASKFNKITRYSTSKSSFLGKKHYINSNPLVRQSTFKHISLSKTGFINEAGMCLVMRVKINNQQYIMVFLKSSTKNQRVLDARQSYKHILTKR